MSAEKRTQNWILVVIVLVVALAFPAWKVRVGEPVVKQGIDLVGGVDLLLEAQFPDEVKDTEKADLLTGALSIIRNRLDPEGVKEIIIQRLGEDRIVIQIPGEDDPERVKDLIGVTATLRFINAGKDPLPEGTKIRLINPDTGLPENIGGLDEEPAPQKQAEIPISTVVPEQVVLTSDKLAGFTLLPVGDTPESTKQVLCLTITDSANLDLVTNTATSIGQYLALTIDNQVVALHKISEALSGGYIPYPDLENNPAYTLDSLNAKLTSTQVVSFRTDPPAVGTKIEVTDPMGQSGETQPSTPTDEKKRVDIMNDPETIIVTGDDFKDAYVQYGNVGEPIIGFEFNSEGARKFGDFTAKHVGEYLAIALDDTIISCPIIRSAILGGRGVIEGRFTMQEAKDLVIKLDSGRLPVPLKIIENRTVGPTLGAKSIEDSKHAAVLGIILVFLFMFLYYRLPGTMAVIALIFYGIVFIGALSILNATLTLPGIAGFIMSIGMAVDANIIIFERLKEELLTGKTFRSAVDAAFKRAFYAIFDSNVTTLITALVLYNLGTGPIKGFAVTLSLGILVSMFSALVFTRLLLETALNSKSTHKYSLYGVSEARVESLVKGGGKS